MRPVVGVAYKITNGEGDGHVGECAAVYDGSFGRVWADLIVKTPVENVKVRPGAESVLLRKRPVDLEEAVE